MTVKLDEAAEAAEFDALVAELEAPQDGDDADDGAAPDGGESTDSEESEEDDEESESQDEDDEENLDEESEKDDEPSAELTPVEKQAAGLFKKGLLKEACRRLGIDPKIFKVKPHEFTAMRKGLDDANRLHSEGTASQARGEKLLADAQNVYGPIVAGYQAYRAGDVLTVKSAIELMCEDTFENVVGAVARAAKGLDPAQLEVIKLRKEMADRDKATQTAQAAEAAKAQETTEIAKVNARLSGTPLEKIDGAAAEIYAVVKASFNASTQKYGKTVKEAYAEVKAKHFKVAQAFGAKPGKKEEKNGKKEKKTELSVVRKQPDLSNMTPEQRKAAKAQAEEEEFQAVLREAKAATRSGTSRRK